MKKRLVVQLIVVTFALLLSVPASATGAAAQDIGVPCTFNMDISFHPPMGAGGSLSGIVITENGQRAYEETGDFDCRDAVFEGESVTGPGEGSPVIGWGTYGLKGTYSGGCVGGMSEGVYTATFPTATGPVFLTGPYQFGWGTFGGGIQQPMGNQRFDGGFGAAPSRGGPCAPAVERAHLAGVGRLGSS